MKRQNRHVIGFRISMGNVDYSGVRHSVIEVHNLLVQDAMEVAKHWTHNEGTFNQFTGMARAIREANGTTEYLSTTVDQPIEFRWQDDRGNGLGNHYALRIESLSPSCIPLLVRIDRAMTDEEQRIRLRDITPRPFIERLVTKLKAVPYRWFEPAHSFIWNKAFDLDSFFPAPQPAEAVA